MVVVDSSAWIEGLRKRGRIEVKLGLEGLLEAYEAKLCDPVRLEVLGGAGKSDRNTLTQAFSILPFRSCTAQDWSSATELAWDIRDQGLTVPWMDVLIATMALRDGDRVYSVDKHFKTISSITGLSLYEPGYGGSYQSM